MNKSPEEYIQSMRIAPADLGEELTVDATAFIPDVEEYWGEFSSFIGQNGFQGSHSLCSRFIYRYGRCTIRG